MIIGFDYHCYKTSSYEYYDLGQWHVSSKEDIKNSCDHILNLIWRHIFFSDEYEYIDYYSGWKRHRLDGPAHVIYNHKKGIIEQAWIVENLFLPDFNHSNCKNHIFAFIEKEPQHLDRVIQLVRQNRWLTEDQIMLLRTLTLFKY